MQIQGAAAQSGYAGYNRIDVPPAQPNQRLDNIENRLSAIQGTLAGITLRTRELSDRLVGPQPEPVSGGNEKIADRPPIVRRLDLLTEDIGRMLETLSSQLSRVESL